MVVKIGGADKGRWGWSRWSWRECMPCILISGLAWTCGLLWYSYPIHFYPHPVPRWVTISCFLAHIDIEWTGWWCSFPPCCSSWRRFKKEWPPSFTTRSDDHCVPNVPTGHWTSSCVCSCKQHSLTLHLLVFSVSKHWDLFICGFVFVVQLKISNDFDPVHSPESSMFVLKSSKQVNNLQFKSGYIVFLVPVKKCPVYVYHGSFCSCLSEDMHIPIM